MTTAKLSSQEASPPDALGDAPLGDAPLCAREVTPLMAAYYRPTGGHCSKHRLTFSPLELYDGCPECREDQAQARKRDDARRRRRQWWMRLRRYCTT